MGKKDNTDSKLSDTLSSGWEKSERVHGRTLGQLEDRRNFFKRLEEDRRNDVPFNNGFNHD